MNVWAKDPGSSEGAVACSVCFGAGGLEIAQSHHQGDEALDFILMYVGRLQVMHHSSSR
jgi:hypothetical protein